MSGSSNITLGLSTHRNVVVVVVVVVVVAVVVVVTLVIVVYLPQLSDLDGIS